LTATPLLSSSFLFTYFSDIIIKNYREQKMKMIRFYFSLAAVFIALNAASPARADKYSNTIELFKQSEAVQPFFANAYGYVVFPAVGKGGFGIGGSYGKGNVYQGGKVTGKASVIKLSVGFQAGGQAFSEIIFFQDKRAYEEFTAGEFAFDAQASAVAITAGAGAQVGEKGVSAGASLGSASAIQTAAHYRKGMAAFVHVRGGLMYEASIGGQKFNFKPTE
jgi:lipid-binding SYLF domain-containing protein